MKKLALTIAIILTMGLGASAQSLLRRESTGGGDDLTTPLIPDYYLVEDQDGEEAPVGSGMAVLVGLGAAYLVGKKRKEA